MIDMAAAFALAFPAWTGPDGNPRTWQHFVYGMRHLARHRARQDLHTAEAVRMAQVTAKHDYQAWHQAKARAAGW